MLLFAQLIRHFLQLCRDSHGLEPHDAVRVVTEGVKKMGLHREGIWLQLARRFKWRSVRDIFYHAQTAITADAVARAASNDAHAKAEADGYDGHDGGDDGDDASAGVDIGGPSQRTWDDEELVSLKAAVRGNQPLQSHRSIMNTCRKSKTRVCG